MNDIAISLDTVWMLLAAMLVFFMQPGFALCEAGFTRGKNTVNILFKNFVEVKTKGENADNKKPM